MSQNNAKDELTAIAIVFAFIGGMVMLAAIFFFALFAFIALVMTCICFFAWNSPLTIGTWTLGPDEARGFVYRGLVGSFLLAAFAVFVAVMFQIRITDEAVPYIVLIGYTLGSLGMEFAMAEDEGQSAPPNQTIIPPSHQIAPPQDYTPPHIPFRFASWDDEDGR